MMKDVIQTLPSTRFVWTRTSYSTNFWWTVFLLFEWIHLSIDQQCSHTDVEHMTPETLYTNQTSSFHMGSPVFLSVIHVLKPLSCEASVKVLFRRQVYSNSSTGLEKSVHDVWNTPPSPIFGALVPLLMTSWEMKFLPSKKILPGQGLLSSLIGW